jgi:hypothetical protein
MAKCRNKAGADCFSGCAVRNNAGHQKRCRFCRENSDPAGNGITNGVMGYAPDKNVAARGGYAADMVPLICGRMPYQSIHSELVDAFLKIDGELN